MRPPRHIGRQHGCERDQAQSPRHAAHHRQHLTADFLPRVTTAAACRYRWTSSPARAVGAGPASAHPSINSPSNNCNNLAQSMGGPAARRFATSAKRSASAKLYAGPTTSAPAVSRVWRMSMAMKGSSSTTRIGTPSSFMASSRPDRPHALAPPQGSWLAPPTSDMRRQYSGTATSLAATVRSKPAIAFLPRDPANSTRPCRGDGPLPVCFPHPPPCPRQRNAMGSVRFLTVQPKAV